MSTQPSPAQTPNTPDPRWQRRAFTTWTLVGACILIGVILYVAGIIWQAVAVVILTALTVFLLHGFVNKLEERKIPRWGGTTIAFLIIVLVIAGCFLMVIPAIVEQLTSFSRQLPTYVSEIQSFVSNLSESSSLFDGSNINAILSQSADALRDQAGTVASHLATGVVGGIVGAGNVVVIVFISAICSFWILLDLPTIVRELNSLVPDKHREDASMISHAFSTAVYGWAKSTIICAIITGVASWLVFMLLGIPYSAVLGLLCGVLYFVPYIGPMISCVLVALIALFVSPLVCIISIVVNMVINNVIGNIISPKIMKDSVNVYPALILIAILIGSALGGIVGMLLSIPVIGAAQGIFIAYFELITGKQLATPDGVLFSLPAPKKPKDRKGAVEKIEEDAGKVKEKVENEVEHVKERLDHKSDQ